MFRPGLRVAAGTLTLKQGAHEAEDALSVERDFRRHGRIGHSGSIQPTSRLQHDVRGPDGALYEAGTPVPHRTDFDTADNPFALRADPAADRLSATPAAALHFVVFNPTSDDFRRNRLAMDSRLPGRAQLGLEHQRLDDVLRATHRQSFLVPARAHRSFPLSELRA